MRNRRDLVKAGILALSLIVILWTRQMAVVDVTHDNCMAINETRAAAVAYSEGVRARAETQLRNSEYYKAHPVELANAIVAAVENQKILKAALRPLKC